MVLEIEANNLIDEIKSIFENNISSNEIHVLNSFDDFLVLFKKNILNFKQTPNNFIVQKTIDKIQCNELIYNRDHFFKILKGFENVFSRINFISVLAIEEKIQQFINEVNIKNKK